MDGMRKRGYGQMGVSIELTRDRGEQRKNSLHCPKLSYEKAGDDDNDE